jgi:hypothetical protein
MEHLNLSDNVSVIHLNIGVKAQKGSRGAADCGELCVAAVAVAQRLVGVR